MILFGLRGIGSGNACLPAITMLKDSGIPVSIYAEAPAYDRFKDKHKLINECDMDSLFKSVKPSLVTVTCSATGGAVPTDMSNKAKQINLPVVLVEDAWSSHSSFKWNHLPDGVCVVDEFAKNLILQSWPGYPESHIHITGAPVFDKFVNIQTESAKHKLRESLCLNENWPIIFFTGEVHGMTQAVSILVSALNNFDAPVYMILRDHPTIILPKAPDEHKKIYLEYHGILKTLKVGIVVDSSKFTSDEVVAGSDIVVGICSTMLAEACYLRKSVLNIWTPEIGQILFGVAGNTFSELPTTNLGASFKVQSAEEIINYLHKIITGDTKAMLQAQQKHFRADGLSGSRVANAILSYYK